MLKSVRNATKSTIGTIIVALFVLAIVASFALADVSNVVSGGFGNQQNELARVGSETITDRDMDEAMQRRLSEVRQQDPEADYSAIAGDFDQVLAGLIEEAALRQFGQKHGFQLSKRLIDAEIASIPGARDLAGRFNEQAYQNFLAQQRLTDAEIRRLISSSMLQRLLLAPVAANARAPVGMARPYASMLLETREGQVGFVPIDRFRQGLSPTAEQFQQFYAANQARYMVPEQRVLRIARIGPEQLSGARATDEEITAYYQQNQAQYAPRESRVISQAVVPGQASAQQIAARARGGQSFASAAAPAGLSAEDISVGPQTREQFGSLAGEQVAAQAFNAQEGAVVGPIQSDLGWHVVKIDAVRREGGRPLAAVRDEIAAQITANKRKDALSELLNRIEDEIGGGASFAEVVRSANLPVTQTPLITANGTARGEPDYKAPEELAPAVSAGFELAEGDDPVIETLADEAGYALVAAERIVPAAPAPLASIRDRVAADWVTAQATEKARQVANAIAQRAEDSPLREAAEPAPVPIPVESVTARRLQLAQFQGQVPPPLAMLFSMGEGKARMVAGSDGEGFYVVKVNRIIPGNALTQPTLITETQQQLQEALSQEYAIQFLAAIREDVGVERNEGAIAEAKRRIAGGR
jgi:peptidyl-prolyl cis-trans isomerase D